MSKLDWLTLEIDGLKEQGLYNRIRTIGSAQGARIVVDGKDVVDRIKSVATGSHGFHRDVPTADVLINKAEKI